MRNALTRTRARRAATAAMVTLLIVAATALGYYLIFGNGEGEGSATLGKGSAESFALAATFANGLKPGQEEPVTYSAHNTSASMAKVATLHASLAVDAPHVAAGCKPEWLSLEQEGNGIGNEGKLNTPVTIAPGETKTLAVMTLQFRETGVNQSACEGATVTIHLTSTPT